MVEVDPLVIAGATVTVVIIASLVFCGISLGSKSSKSAEFASEKITKPEGLNKPKKKKNASKEKKTIKPVQLEEDAVVSNPVKAPVKKEATSSQEKRKSPEKVPAPSTQKTVEPRSLSNGHASKPAPKITPEVVNQVEEAIDSDSDAEIVVEAKKSVPAPAPVPLPVPVIEKPLVQEVVAPMLAESDGSQDDAWAVVKKTKKKVVPAQGLPGTSPVGEESQPPVPFDEPLLAAPVVPPEPIDKVTEEIIIPAKKIGAVIGVKGIVKISIQLATGTDISLPKVAKESTEPVTVTITGPAEGVKKAKKAVNDLITKGYSAVLESEDFRETQVGVQTKYLPDIIGKGGANIRALQEQLEVRIVVPQTTGPEVKAVKINISGMKDNVIRAKALIKELIMYYHTEITHPGFIHEELDIPSAFYNYIIGAKGSEIKHIQANFKVSVHIPNLESVNKNVVIVGLPQNVANAQKYILKIIDNIMNGIRKDGKSKTAAPEEEVVDTLPPDAEARPHEVLFSDLMSTARQVHSTNGLNGSLSRVGVALKQDEISPVPIVEPKAPVSSVWNTGSLAGGHTGGGVLAAGTTGVDW